MTTLLYVTDLLYPANGRRYGDEDVFVTSRLREHFDLAITHPLDAASLLDAFDVVVFRNTGPVIHYQAEHASFREQAARRNACIYNTLTGRADMCGKQYLVDLTGQGFPVIPTADSHAGVAALPVASSYIVKPKAGSDSIGLRRVGRDDLASLDLDGSLLVQPAIDFVHEVSFYFVDRTLQYALHAPDPAQRWQLVECDVSADDLRFAQRFVDWNTIDHGIQRVDACRTPDGGLLLMELEDLNPFLSLEVLPDPVRERFLDAMRVSIGACLEAHRATL